MTPRRLIEPARLAGGPLLRTQTDERLVDLTRAGNDRAFEAIVHRYRRPLLRYCSRLLPPQRAEDAVQQAFVSAYGAMCSSEAELNLRPWLYRIAHNASLNLLRQNGWDHEEIDETVRVLEDGPDLAAERNEHLASVLRAVEELPERQRDAVVLRALEGRSYDEIAAELDVTGGAVRQLLNRARTTLRSAATAVTPPELLVRLGGGAVESGIGPRIAEVVAGSGGTAMLAKLGAAVVVAGAVGAGAVEGPDIAGITRDAEGADARVTREAGNGGDNEALRVGDRHDASASRGSGGRSGSGPGSGDVVLDSSGSSSGGNSGPGSGDSDDGITLEGDNSGPGGGSSGSNSGPGSGTVTVEGDNSGSGSTSSGSSGGDSSGSASGSSGSDSSGSGSPGSGSGDDDRSGSNSGPG